MAQTLLEMLATLLQRGKSAFKGLQDCCNGEKVVFGVCKIVASISKSTLAVTVLYQGHSSGIRSLIFFRRIRIL